MEVNVMLYVFQTELQRLRAIVKKSKQAEAHVLCATHAVAVTILANVYVKTATLMVVVASPTNVE
jgi:hypothetical protein